MPRRNDGNESDIRIRRSLDAPSLDADNPFTGAIPEGKDPCVDGYGSQTDISVTTPSTGGTVGYDWSDVSRVCPRGFDTRTLDLLLMRLLRNHFSKPDCILHETVKPFVYSDDPNESKISIQMNTTVALNPDKLPQLTVKRGAQRASRMVMGDRGEEQDWEAGEERYSRFMQGTHQIFCTAAGDGFTEDLANEVFDFLNAVSPVLRTDLPLHDFQVSGMSELGIVEELATSLGVVIEVAYVYEYSWTITRIAPTLTRSATDLTVSIHDTSEDA